MGASKRIHVLGFPQTPPPVRFESPLPVLGFSRPPHALTPFLAFPHCHRGRGTGRSPSSFLPVSWPPAPFTNPRVSAPSSLCLDSTTGLKGEGRLPPLAWADLEGTTKTQRANELNLLHLNSLCYARCVPNPHGFREAL